MDTKALKINNLTIIPLVLDLTLGAPLALRAADRDGGGSDGVSFGIFRGGSSSPLIEADKTIFFALTYPTIDFD